MDDDFYVEWMNPEWSDAQKARFKDLLGTTPSQQQQQFVTSTPDPSDFQRFIRSQQGRRGLDLDDLRRVLWQNRINTLVVWVSNNRFTYAAINARDTWYITGSGVFYGKNEFNHDEFVRDVLGHSEVTSIWVSNRFKQIYQR